MPWILRLILFAAIVAAAREVDDRLFIPAAIVMALILTPFAFSSRNNDASENSDPDKENRP